MTSDFTLGAVVYWEAQAAYGVVQAVDHRTFSVLLDTGEQKTFVDGAAPVERVQFEVGQQVQVIGTDGDIGVVLAEVENPVQPMWSVSLPGGHKTHPEGALRPAILDDPVERLATGLLGTPDEFNLKSVAADLWLTHLHNPLISLAHARVDLKPHQVSVVHRVISNYPHRFMLCDEVGLGKTIEAAMVIKELRARKQAARVLILVPSGLLRQWQFELKTKFNESFAIFNRQTVDYLKNDGSKYPWLEKDSVIASHTWTSWSPERRDEVANCAWDLIIVDEAHHARKQRAGSRVRRTKLYQLVNALTAAPGCERRAVMFLTATPMQLQRHELYSLVEMVDPVLFASEQDFESHLDELSTLNQTVEQIEQHGLPTERDEAEALSTAVAELLDINPDRANAYVDGDPAALVAELRATHRLSEVLIRNRRSVVGGFQPRSAFRWEVELTNTEKRIQSEMDEVLRLGFELSKTTGRNVVGFLMTTFQKLAASSSRALLASLRKRLAKLKAGETPSAAELSLSDAEDRFASDEEVAAVLDEAGIIGVPGSVFDPDYEIDAISLVIELLEQVGIDSKTKVLAQQLVELFDEESDAKVLIFTEFRETQSMLEEVLRGSGWGVNLFHGQLSPLQKDDAVEQFRVGIGPQILVCTEAGGEGRNMQFCHYLVNYDLPWNPMKVEQRIGRVDRIGQEFPVTVFNFHVIGTIEGRILDVLENRINLFEASVGGLEPILGETESDLRKALQLSADKRDAALAELERKTERSVKRARDAETQLSDLVLDSKSFSAGIAQLASGESSPISQAQWETFLQQLLVSANVYVKQPPENGVYKIMYHPPFALQRQDLVGPDPKRRVSFNPDANVDSEMVEYMGFGHPIVDELVRMTVSENTGGSATVRRVASIDCQGDGWQFNFLVKIKSVRGKASVFTVFVSDEGDVDLEAGQRLLRRSYSFEHEQLAARIEGTAARAAYEQAQTAAIRHASALQRETAAKAEADAEVEEQRIKRVFEHRMRATIDKVEQSKATLTRMSQGSEDQRRTVNMWEANVRNAEAQLDAIRDDREAALLALAKKRTPTFEFDLLNAARIVVGRGEYAAV